MLYNHQNARGATVHDIEARTEIRHVQSVEVDAGVVTVIDQPIRVDRQRDEVVTSRLYFTSIYCIKDRSRPVLFHCYGRQAATDQGDPNGA